MGSATEKNQQRKTEVQARHERASTGASKQNTTHGVRGIPWINFMHKNTDFWGEIGNKQLEIY